VNEVQVPSTGRYRLDLASVEREMRGRHAEEYQLEVALRPSVLQLSLEQAGLVAQPDPILTVYRGKATGRRVYHRLHLTGESP
jgi:hypothetical protein